MAADKFTHGLVRKLAEARAPDDTTLDITEERARVAFWYYLTPDEEAMLHVIDETKA